jgi:hypothetical protein
MLPIEVTPTSVSSAAGCIPFPAPPCFHYEHRRAIHSYRQLPVARG